MSEAQVHEAIGDELSYCNANVWGGVSLADAHKDTEGKVLNGSWVLRNNGDVADPDVRARYVACETNTSDDLSDVAATPPLEANRLPMPQWMSQRTRDGERLQIHCADARKD